MAEPGYRRLAPGQPVGLKHSGYVITLERVVKVHYLFPSLSPNILTYNIIIIPRIYFLLVISLKPYIIIKYVLHAHRMAVVSQQRFM